MNQFYHLLISKLSLFKQQGIRITILIFICFLAIRSRAQTAINFNNSTQTNAQHVAIGASTTLKPNLVTVELWARSPLWHRGAGDNTLISNTQGGGYAMYVQAGTGNLVFIAYANGTYQGAAIAASGLLVNNRWHHLAGSWDGTTARIYVDGVLRASSATLGSSYNIAYGNAGNRLFVGAESAGTGATPEANRYFDGQIDDVRIWNYARSLNDIKKYILLSPAANASGLLAHYKFDEASGSTVVNRCTNTSGLNGSIVNATWYSPSPVKHSNNALQFDGTDDQISTNMSLSGRSSFTLEGWLYPTAASDRIAFFGQNDAIEFGFSSANTITGYTANTGAGGTNSVSWTFDNSNFPLNTWHHVAFTADGSNMRLYVDGILRSTSYNPNTNYGTSADLFHIGGTVWDASGNYYSGAIDEVRVWSVARSQAEIQQLMNDEIDPTVEANLVAYYNFNQGLIADNNNGLLVMLDQKGANNGLLSNFALSGSASNYVAQRPALVTLPLAWTSFSAQRQNEVVRLNWTTANETNTKDFVIQHRTETGNWANLAIVPADPGADLTGAYQFVHLSPAARQNYYRIQQRDVDGRFSYSRELSVNFDTNAMLQAFPNPVANGQLTLNLPSTGEVMLYTVDGKLVLRKQLSQGKQVIDVSRLPGGLYRLIFGNNTVNVLIR